LAAPDPLDHFRAAVMEIEPFSQVTACCARNSADTKQYPPGRRRQGKRGTNSQDRANRPLAGQESARQADSLALRNLGSLRWGCLPDFFLGHHRAGESQNTSATPEKTRAFEKLRRHFGVRPCGAAQEGFGDLRPT
jgi:hypothetical protein